MAEWMAAEARQREDGSEVSPPPEMMDRMQPRVRTPGRTTKAEMSAAEEPSNKPATLKEVLNEMTLSILLYDEDKAGRMVFINGRKYVEGDLVEPSLVIGASAHCCGRKQNNKPDNILHSLLQKISDFDLSFVSCTFQSNAIYVVHYPVCAI
jgi:hypothetical protein